ncbi:MAG: extracellular solute-binding protein [Phycisphaerae bacterium]|nr:extracellular solute-binding protein [Phycisphaerae bacterium]
MSGRLAGPGALVGLRVPGGLAVLVALVVAGLGLRGCSREPSAAEVVLYSSVDSEVLRPIITVFERERGVKVLLVGDTEATKTTGLAQRLLAERDAPRADVWWSSEALSTARLAAAGVLAPLPPAKSEADLSAWPPELRSSGDEWFGFALRARVLVYNPKRLSGAEVPATLADLTRPSLKARVGMARPEFGTTRGHIAALRHIAGGNAVDAWLNAMEANGVRMYDGNASVVRGVAMGEIDVGLTDTDDVRAGQANGWSIAQAFERRGAGSSGAGSPSGDSPDARFGAIGDGTGALLIPNTVALVKGARHLDAARALIQFIRSDRVERMLAESDWGTMPVRPDLASQYPALMVPGGTLVDWEAIAQAEPAGSAAEPSPPRQP